MVFMFYTLITKMKKQWFDFTLEITHTARSALFDTGHLPDLNSPWMACNRDPRGHQQVWPRSDTLSADPELKYLTMQTRVKSETESIADNRVHVTRMLY